MQKCPQLIEEGEAGMGLEVIYYQEIHLYLGYKAMLIGGHSH